MVEGEDYSNDRKTSKYNSGVAIQIRLDELWKDANRHSRARQFDKWNMDLDNIWRELARDFDEKEDDKEYKKYKGEFDYFSTKLSEQGPFMDSAPAGWVDLNLDDKKKRRKHYDILQEKELFLKRLENHLGKGTAWDKGEDAYMDG